MVQNVNEFKITCSLVLAACTALWGWFGWLVILYLISTTADYLTGTLYAKRAGVWSSTVAREGIMHKVGMLAAIGAAGIFDITIQIVLSNIPSLTLPFEYTVMFCPLVIVWYIFTELGSIVENAVKMGAEVPTWLAKALAVSREMVDKTNTQDENEK